MLLIYVNMLNVIINSTQFIACLLVAQLLLCYPLIYYKYIFKFALMNRI